MAYIMRDSGLITVVKGRHSTGVTPIVTKVIGLGLVTAIAIAIVTYDTVILIILIVAIINAGYIGTADIARITTDVTHLLWV